MRRTSHLVRPPFETELAEKERKVLCGSLSPSPRSRKKQGFNPTFLVVQVMVLQELGKAQNAKSYFFFAHFSGGLVKLWNPCRA